MFYDALRDYRALKLLESQIGRDKTLDLLEEGLDSPLSFTNYPHSDNWHIKTREKINGTIKNNLKKSGS